MSDAFELSAAVALWRGDEVLVMKRAAGFASGGWFFPGGHLEPGERPAEACVRELREETGIVLDGRALAIADVMTYQAGDGTAHCVIYNASCPPGAEPCMNDEHLFFRWMAPEAFIARFLDQDTLRARGLPEDALALAAEVARVVRAAAARRGKPGGIGPRALPPDPWPPPHKG